MRALIFSLKLIAGAMLATLLGYMIGFAMYAQAGEQVRIAVVDSGYNTTPEPIKLCAEGHRDFTGTGLKDDLGHGTAVASIISSHIKNTNACIVVVKVFTRKRKNQMLAYLAGLEYVTKLNVKYVNMSLAGWKPDLPEEVYVQRLLTQGKRVLAAAGNEGMNLDKVGCVIYPACYDSRIKIVGDSTTRHRRNWGSFVDYYDNGAKQLVNGSYIEGTSMATAHVTGKLVSGELK